MTDMILNRVDDLLEDMVMEEKIHFAPQYICNRLGVTDLEAITDYLFTLVPRKLTLKLEVECPEGHSDFAIANVTEIPNEIHECHYCGIEYQPDPEHIWVSFDFSPEYAKYVKKKRSDPTYFHKLSMPKKYATQLAGLRPENFRHFKL